MAPGADIWSTLPNAQYAAWDGTSMAAPIVSGVAALARTKWNDKVLYSSRFIMGQIAAAATPVADAINTLTNTPKPEIRYMQHWLFDTPAQAAGNDADGVVDSGETVDLAIAIRNHWGKADNVTVTLDAWAEGASGPDPYVTVLTNIVDYGAIGSFNWDDNGLVYSNQAVVGVLHPFRIRVDANTPNDHIIPVRLTISAKNGLDASDPTTYSIQSRFELRTRRGVEVFGEITQDQTWTADHYYIITAPVLIPTGVTVTIQPGTIVAFEPGKYIVVEGTLRAIGSRDNRIQMRPNSSGRWGTIVFHDSQSDNELAYVDVQDGGSYVALFSTSNGGASVWPFNSRINIHHCRFYANVAGIDLGTGAAGPTSGSRIHHNIFTQNEQALNLGYGNAVLADFNTLVGNGCAVKKSSSGSPHLGLQLYNSSLFSNGQFDIYAWTSDSGCDVNATNNYWGTVNVQNIGNRIWDYYDTFSGGKVHYQPVLSGPDTNAPPIVHTVDISPAPPLSIGSCQFTLTFSSDMDTNISPAVAFGPAPPYSDNAINGSWADVRRWVGSCAITPLSGDGQQTLFVHGAVGGTDGMLTPTDTRFHFEIITSGAESMNLQATGAEGKVDLSWIQDNFDLLAGYHLYRSTSPSSGFVRLNSALIPSDIKIWSDTSVTPGQLYYYKFTVVKSDMGESDFSNVAEGRPLDTIPPVLSHTPIMSHPAGQNLTIPATATDNVGVQALTLYFRTTGTSPYTSRAMTHISGSQYAATIEGSRVVSPGLEYYIEATDGISIIRSGLASNPWQITVSDRPVVTVVTPNHGPASGGTFMTVSGSNFKTGATVSIGSVPATGVTVVNANQITCTTGSHFPAAADVMVTNPDAQTGTLLRGFTYESDVASVSLPNTGGAHGSIVQIPINAANVQGLRSADLTVTFDPAVLEYRTVRTGSLTPGWSVLGNSPSSGQVRVSLAHMSSSSGAGTLASLEFEVIGVAGASCALGLPTMLLNDGAILVQIAAGSLAVNPVYDVTGAVSFWNGGTGVPGVLCTLQGDQVFTATSGGSGAFTVAGAAAGSYTLVPSKSDTVNGITAYDASLVLQHAVGLITLSGHAATAADVNKSGAVTSFDAAYILEKSVDLIPVPFPGAGVVWDFSPTSRTITSLSGNLPGQDFTAILLGDVSGNWSPSAGAPPSPRGGGSNGPKDPPPAVTLALRTVNTRSNGTEFWLLARAQESPIYSLDLVLSNRLSQGLAGLRSGAFAETMAVTSNTNNRNLVRVGLAGAVPLRGVGALLVLTLPNGGSNDVALISALIQEGTVPVRIDPSGDSFDADTDGDGQTDWAEIRAGTVATDRRSVFALRAVTLERGETPKISWSAVPGKLYQVWFMPEGVGGDWQLLGAPVQAASEEANVLDDASMFGFGRMYRVQLVE